MLHAGRVERVDERVSNARQGFSSNRSSTPCLLTYSRISGPDSVRGPDRLEEVRSSRAHLGSRRFRAWRGPARRRHNEELRGLDVSILSLARPGRFDLPTAREDDGVGEGDQEHLPVFHRRGRPISDLYTRWREATKVAKVSDRLIHDLRWPAVRNLGRAGVPRRSR